MVENVVLAALPVNENLRIRRNRIEPPEGNDNRGRISIVTGTHGDELEGQFVCYELIRRIRQNSACLNGTVDIYPVLNPLGADSGLRTVPRADVDLDWIFPGNQNGTMLDKAVAQIVDSLMDSDICIDIQVTDALVKEIPHVRISNEFQEILMPYAKELNVDLIWTNTTSTVHDSKLSQSLCKLGVPAIVMEMGLGNRINQEYGLQVVDGIFHLMKCMGFWSGEDISVKKPRVISDDDIEFIRAPKTGIFLPGIENNTIVRRGEKIGEIIDPLRGKSLYKVKAGQDGLLFSMREHPLAYEGALLARVIKGTEEGRA
jgi:predicted deacylase